MRRSVVLAVASLWALGCSSNPAPADVVDGSDAAVVPDDVPSDMPAGDGASPNAPLTYMPAGCSYTVTTAPPVMTYQGATTTNNRLGDDSTFGPMPDPQNVHVNWPADPSSTAAVLWATDAATLATVVQYGTDMTNLGQTAMGHRMTAGSGSSAANVHEVHLCGLSPDTTYYYRAGGPGHFSPVQRFRTAPAPGAASYDINFAVAGDSRDDPTVLGQLQQRILAVDAMHQPDFELFTGDAVVLASMQPLWNAWFAAAQPGLAVMPWLMVHGNHEMLAVNYIAQFAQPQEHGELYFSLDYGPIHFVVLNDTIPTGGDYATLIQGDQRTWLEADLRAVDRARTPWVIVTHHKSAYSVGARHGSEADTLLIRSTWPALFDQYNVDLVLNGHEHDLEVTQPLRAGTPVAAGQRGTVYVIAAGAGATLDPVVTSPLMAYQESVNNFLIVHVTAHDLTVTPYRIDGTTVPTAQVTLSRP
jgi:hypothetical protein